MHVASNRLARQPHTYELHVGPPVAALLQWRSHPRGVAGWYLHHPVGTSRRLTVDPGLDTLTTRPAGDGDWAALCDEAAIVSTALALDEAARILLRAPTRPSRTVPAGGYEVHVAGLAASALPIAFPEATAVTAADTAILSGHFDDARLDVIVRRIALLGGRLLALLPA
jgi:hypothetical protein